MSNNIETIERTDWTQFGYNSFGNRKLQPIDKSFMTDEDINSMIEDSSLSNSKMSNTGKIVKQFKVSYLVNPTVEVNGFSVGVNHGLGYIPILTGTYKNQFDNSRRMIPDIRSFTEPGSGIGYRTTDWVVTFSDISETSFFIEFQVNTFKGYAAYSYYIDCAFEFEINAYREGIFK